MKRLSVIFSILALVCSCSQSQSVYDLKTEYLDQPLALDTAKPHFSWKINPKAAKEQSAYQIELASSPQLLASGKADLWNSSKQLSSDQLMIEYQGVPLASRQQCWWRVQVWDENGKSLGWSDAARFGLGFVNGDKLAGDYIGCCPGEGRSAILRKSFECEDRAQAILYVCSLGYHEAYLNGVKLTDAVLTPAVSQLDKRALIVAYDVKDLLRKGENELLLWTGSGWYKPDTFNAVYQGALVKAELDIFPKGEAKCLVTTDSTWKGAWSGYSDSGSWQSGDFGGEVVDARVAPAAIDAQSLDSLEWGPVDLVTGISLLETCQTCQLCTIQEQLTPVSVEPFEDGRWIVDFGKVVNAQLDITLPALPAGHEVTVGFNDDMNDLSHMRYYGSNRYIASGKGTQDHFVDKFNHHVFRYLVIDGLSEAPSVEDFKALRMRTSYDSAGSFECSDEDMNKVHDMILYTLENLAFNGYMVDCASIERLGYGGDGNASTLTLQNMFDVAPLYSNWMAAWRDMIQEDGGLPHTAPSPTAAGGGPYWCGFIVQAPWRTYMSYGDSREMENCYSYMKQWLKYVDAYTVDGLLKRWPDTEYRNWYLGDWAAPGKGTYEHSSALVDVSDPESVDLVNNCSLCQVYQDLVQIASLLGDEEGVKEYQGRYDALALRINEEYCHPETCTYGSASQTDMCYPMLVGIVPEELKDGIRDNVIKRTKEIYGGNLYTGLVGVPVITEWATLDREVDFMYGMLKERDYPGYLFMIDNGATATWEHWNAHRSRLHNCFNGIGSWFYQALGGIIPVEPGYRKLSIAPQIPAGMEWAKVARETPYGSVMVSWKTAPDGVELHFELPVGVTAIVNGQEYACGQYDIKYQQL